MTANLYEKNGMYHVMISWKQGDQRKQKSIATHIPIQGNNKRRAETARRDILAEWEERVTENYCDILFSDYLKQWLETVKHSVAVTTYIGYKSLIERQISPYFDERKIMLSGIKPRHIQDFYTWKMDIGGVSANTVHHYHANIHKALKYAAQTDLIRDNPASKVTLPKVEEYHGDFYTQDELIKLIEAAKGTKLEVPIMLCSWFGMRRGEVVGCRWDAINFDSKTLFMCGTITDRGAGTQTENLTYRSFGKTASSIRTFPLTDTMVTYLKDLMRRQQNNRELVGRAYSEKWTDFLCVDEVGNLVQPEYISYTFPKLLKKHGLRRIRFHDLRHTNATLLLEEGASLKEVQDWMGHKSLMTTADIYAHVQAKAKLRLSETMNGLLSKAL